MPDKQISYEEYLKVHGLLAIGHEWMKKANDVEQMLGQMLEPEVYPSGGQSTGGHCGDAMWAPYGADELLCKLKISIAPQEGTSRESDSPR